MSFLAPVRGAKVLLVSHQLDLSGAPLFLLELGDEMRRSGADVTFVNLHRRVHAPELLGRFCLPLCSVDASFAAAARADLILANTAPAKTWLRAWLSRDFSGARRAIWWIHEIDVGRFGGSMDPSAHVAAVLFDSHASLTQWHSAGLELPPLSRVIHLGVSDMLIAAADADRFPDPRPSRLARLSTPRASLSRDAIRTRLGVGPDDFLLSLFGYYAPEKGQELLLRTVARMLERSPTLLLKVLLVGSGVRDALLARLGALERRATNDGVLVRDATPDLRPLYAASDAYVMNSQGCGENFGRVTTEAMAFRLPVLGTGLGGTPEIVVDGVTGLLHPPGESGQDQLAQHIQWLIHDREQAREMGRQGRQRVRSYFNHARVYAELRPVIEAIVQR